MAELHFRNPDNVEVDEYNERFSDESESQEHSEGLQKKYTTAFMRQISTLRRKREKRNKYREKKSFLRDADNGLSYTKMIMRVAKAHPRLMKEGQLVKYPICTTHTGWNLPSKRCRQTGLKEFGVGICLYFKWLKYLVCIFFVLVLLSIPALIFFISASDGDFKTHPSFDTMLALTTLGNMGTDFNSCGRTSNLKSSVSFY